MEIKCCEAKEFRKITENYGVCIHCGMMFAYTMIFTSNFSMQTAYQWSPIRLNAKEVIEKIIEGTDKVILLRNNSV